MNRVECPYCDQMLKGEGFLKKHIRIKHPQEMALRESS